MSHGMPPISGACPMSDGYSPTATSKAETVHGINVGMNYMFNQRMANLRDTVKNRYLIDPTIVNYTDFLEDNDSPIIRIMEDYWGQDVISSNRGIKQLQVNDYTSGTLNEIFAMSELMRTFFGSSDARMGSFRKRGERLTSIESQAAASGSVNRILQIARMMFYQGIAPMGYQIAENIRTYSTEDFVVSAYGDLLEYFNGLATPGELLKVSPDKIDVPLDIVSIENYAPAPSDVESWLRIMEVARQYPTLATRYDFPKLFEHAIRLSGVRNIDQFRLTGNQIQAEVYGSEGIDNQLQQGNIVPVGTQ